MFGAAHPRALAPTLGLQRPALALHGRFDVMRTAFQPLVLDISPGQIRPPYRHGNTYKNPKHTAQRKLRKLPRKLVHDHFEHGAFQKDRKKQMT